MQKKSILLDGVRVIGTTLWSHVPDDRASEVADGLNDYRMIYIKENLLKIPITVNHTNSWFQDEVLWVSRSLVNFKLKVF